MILKSPNSKSESHKFGRSWNLFEDLASRSKSQQDEWTLSVRIMCARDRITKERKRERERKKREKEDDGDVATRVVDEVKQTTDRSPLLLYGVHHGVDFQRYSSRRPQRRGGFDGTRGWEVGGGERSDTRARKRGRDSRSERVRGDTY